MRTILITGGCGFIGTNLVADLERRGGWHVRVLDDESLGRRGDLAGLSAEFIAGDIRDDDVLRRALHGADAVVHLAADTRVIDSLHDPENNFRRNVVGTFKLLTAMREAGVGRLVNASTGGAILGEAEPPIHEDMPARPVSPYGASKLAAEAYCSAFAGSFGLHAASLRFANVYGPRSYRKGSVVAHFFKRLLAGEELVIYGDGTQTRDYVYVGDICEGIVRALEAEASGAFQLGAGRPVRLDELIGLIRATVGEAYPVRVRYEDSRPGEVRHTWCDIAKARAELGYAPAMSLEEGLRRTWAWFQDAYPAGGRPARRTGEPVAGGAAAQGGA